MITRITGILTRVLDEEIRLQVGGFEYQVLVPEFVRRLIQSRVNKELSLYTFHYFEGDPSRGKMAPRLVGFLAETELEFFELFCTVDGVGTRKALKALARPVKDIADAIARQDSKWLTSLPGVGASTGEKIVASLKRKVTRFTVAPTSRVSEAGEIEVEPTPTAMVEGSVLEEAYSALVALGLSPLEARNRLDRILTSGKSFTSVEEVIREIYGK